MIQSDSVANELRRLAEAYNSADMATVEAAHSQEPGTLALGTDPTEWWEGHDEIVGVFTAQLKEMPSFRFSIGRVAGYEEGSVGWAVADCTVSVEGIDPMPSRMTVVFHKEDEAWKIVFSQLSFTISNAKAFGQELPG